MLALLLARGSMMELGNATGTKHSNTNINSHTCMDIYRIYICICCEPLFLNKCIYSHNLALPKFTREKKCFRVHLHIWHLFWQEVLAWNWTSFGKTFWPGMAPSFGRRFWFTMGSSLLARGCGSANPFGKDFFLPSYWRSHSMVFQRLPNFAWDHAWGCRLVQIGQAMIPLATPALPSHLHQGWNYWLPGNQWPLSSVGAGCLLLESLFSSDLLSQMPAKGFALRCHAQLAAKPCWPFGQGFVPSFCHGFLHPFCQPFEEGFVPSFCHGFLHPFCQPFGEGFVPSFCHGFLHPFCQGLASTHPF